MRDKKELLFAQLMQIYNEEIEDLDYQEQELLYQQSVLNLSEIFSNPYRLYFDDNYLNLYFNTVFQSIALGKIFFKEEDFDDGED